MSHDFQEVKTFLETLYISNRLKLPFDLIQRCSWPLALDDAQQGLGVLCRLGDGELGVGLDGVAQCEESLWLSIAFRRMMSGAKSSGEKK